MDAVTMEALADLNSSLSSLIPPTTEPEHTPVLLVVPNRVRPTGVGGFIGLNANPAGEIYGRRIEASVSITIKAGAPEDLKAAIDAVTHSLISADRATLAQSGILNLSVKDLGPLNINGSGNNQIAERELSAQVLYEFLKLPEQAGGLIKETPLELDLVPGGKATFLVNMGFDADAMNQFDIVDDPHATRYSPSNWLFNEAEHRIEQLSAIRGGSFRPTIAKAGTYLVLKTASNRPAVQDFMLQIQLSSSDVDGIGVVFRWQDQDNFYYFLMSARRGWRMMGRKIAGRHGYLETAALDENTGYNINTRYKLKLQAQGENFTAFLNGELILSGADTVLSEAGRVGFMCHGNAGAYFHSIKLMQY